MQNNHRRGIAPGDLFAAVGIARHSSVMWLERVSSQRPGVYIVSLHSDRNNGSGLADAPVSSDALERWLVRCPGLTVYGKRVGVDALGLHLARWWLPNTSILYIGKAGGQSLSARVDQYYRTPLGNRSPHGGGYWLKTLGILDDVSVHCAETPENMSPDDCKDDLLSTFLRLHQIIPHTHPEPTLLLPWANLQVDRPPPRRSRDHGLPSLKNQRQPR